MGDDDGNDDGSNARNGVVLHIPETINSRHYLNGNSSMASNSNSEMIVENESQPVYRSESRRFWNINSYWKGLKYQHGQWNCFLCCHVCTGTIVIGLWHMILRLIILSLIGVAVVHPEILQDSNKNKLEKEYLMIQDVQAVNCSYTPCLLAAQGNGHLLHPDPDFPIFSNLISVHQLNREDVNVTLFINICTLIITILMVHGAFRGQPSQLMPFFFLQVFEFCIYSMTMVSYLSYLPNIQQMIHEAPSFPFQQYLLGMNKKCLNFFILLILIASFMIKAYCINIVWRCYKYLMQNSQGYPWTLQPRTNHCGPVDQESQTLVVGADLPDYDTAITDPQYRKKRSSVSFEPPPSYELAMAAFREREAQGGEEDAPKDQANGAAVEERFENVRLLENGERVDESNLDRQNPSTYFVYQTSSA